MKQEISEVVDFLKSPGTFKEIGARIPKGVLLVGPPGTGKTLLARAVAGEAGVPFLSVTGSDFMEMFVGVGASRVRDLFQTARKQAPAIIFVDEIDSIGRKRGAGLGGGHDEREQTLNQMLSEMDGFDASEGVVMMAATNRPDILDPALLRPGRFDRQIVVPLPDLEERLADPRRCTARTSGSAPTSTSSVVARGTPGMSGADLANLVNEAALHAVRRGQPRRRHARLRRGPRPGAAWASAASRLVLSEDEKERVAYHEGGHAVLAYVLAHADPLHKVTIIPTGHGARRHPAAPARGAPHLPARVHRGLARACAWAAASPSCSSTATSRPAPSNDLIGNTELARKMVREWGMCDARRPDGLGLAGHGLPRRGPHALPRLLRGHRRVIDEEVERILREQEERAMEVLSKHRAGLEAVARALLEHETIDGAEVARLIDEAYGRPCTTRAPSRCRTSTRRPSSRARRQRRQRQRQRGRRTRRRRCRHRGRRRPRLGAVPAAPAPPARAGGARSVASPAVAPAGQPGDRHPGGSRHPLRHGALRIEPILTARRHEEGWWSNSSQTGWRTATWPPSARRA